MCAEKTIKVLAVAYKNLGSNKTFTEEDEKEMTFLGYLEFLDPIKKDVKEQLDNLKNLGIDLKIISGDNFAIVNQIGHELKFEQEPLLGSKLENLSDAALAVCCETHSLFAEVNPLNKERIIHALKSHGHIVGFLGDGINDCAAMQSADVSISVDQGANIAKESADFIMTNHSLDVLQEGVLCGRKTFANTLKYIFMATSANFGNMFSMAFSSLILPFIPFLPKQILLINFLTDIPEFTISTDHVDKDWLISPQKWNFSLIKKFMVVFGLLSSFFDFTTFFLLKFLDLSQQEFRTAWFLESVISAASVLLIVRTKHSLFSSFPSRYLSCFVAAIICITLALPYFPIGRMFGFTPLKGSLVLLMSLIVILYVIAAEITKKIFYKNKL
jgi:Mg2+-importing ATPase